MGTAVASILVATGIAAVLLNGRTKWLILVLLIAAYLPSATAGFVAGAAVLFVLVLVLGVGRLATPLGESERALLAALAWACFAWLANLGQETDAWSLPVAILTFWTPWLVVFLLRAENWSLQELAKVRAAWAALIVVQLAPALLKPLILDHPGAYLVPVIGLRLAGIHVPDDPAVASLADFTSGTTTSAHQLGILSLLGAAYFAALFWRTRRRPALLVAGVLALLLLMTDAKHVLLSALLALLPAGGLLLWRELQRRARLAVIVTGIVVVTAGTAFAMTTIVQLARAGLWAPLVAVTSFNPKVQLYARTAALMRPGELHTWIGYGPGAFASRAASSRATGALYKQEARLPSFIPPFTAPAYGATVSDLYTANIVATSGNRSDVLTSPFSSFVGIVAEYGIVGTLVVGWFLVALLRLGVRTWRNPELSAGWRATGAALAFGILLLVVLSFFDSYFEQPVITIPIATLWLLASMARARVQVS
ncbi:MAG TPA: hypothetical protein VFO96_06485 [Gemmatimonadales bacterium]|jgi:hypothetical protein|nr:hypothetical protein [Gemmatimonadales bacterium]